MICDWATVTVPERHSHEVYGELKLLLHAVGALQATEEIWRIGASSTVKVVERNGFTVFGTSGGVLGELRSRDLFDDYLSVFSSVPHRVSRMDIAHDVFSPSHKILKSIYNRANSGSIQLTRKTLNPGPQIRRIMSKGSDGLDTGTVYLGTRKSEVSARIYDKQNEVLSKGGPDIGPTTRYELTITDKAGASLRDVHQPNAAFWHFMSDVLPPPANAPVWEKGFSGYVIDRKSDLLPAELLAKKVALSSDIRSLLELADEIGPNGFKYLVRQLEARYDSVRKEFSKTG